MYDLYIFDADGTLRRTKSGKVAPNHRDDWELLPGVAEWFKTHNPQKWGIVSNQGGVSLGLVPEEEALAALFALKFHLGHLVPRHVKYEISMDKSHQRRKPNPGMLLELMEEFKVPPDRTLMVGDMASDEEAAKNAGCHYMHPKDLFLW